MAATPTAVVLYNSQTTVGHPKAAQPTSPRQSRGETSNTAGQRHDPPEARNQTPRLGWQWSEEHQDYFILSWDVASGNWRTSWVSHMATTPAVEDIHDAEFVGSRPSNRRYATENNRTSRRHRSVNHRSTHSYHSEYDREEHSGRFEDVDQASLHTISDEEDKGDFDEQESSSDEGSDGESNNQRQSRTSSTMRRVARGAAVGAAVLGAAALGVAYSRHRRTRNDRRGRRQLC